MVSLKDFRSGQKRDRTLEERITDRFLLLYLIHDAGEVVGKTKLQKLAYLSEFEMNTQGFKGLNFNFIKMPFGPYSGELKKDCKLFFIQLMINLQRWRFSYGRQPYKRIFSKTKIFLPVNNENEIDENYIESVVTNCYGWTIVSNYLTQ